MTFTAFCLLILSTLIVDGFAVKSTLQQVHVIFRHGDRNPEKTTIYPTDPNINDTWAPDGFGELTMRGKVQEYNIGIALRKRYGNFLGEIYNSDLIDPISTDLNRTKMSLELALAGLFPPVSPQIWNELLPWQPIPYNYVSIKNDPIMRFVVLYCPNYSKLFYEAERSDYSQKFWNSNIDLIDYISKNSGINVESYLNLFTIFDALYSETQTGRKIPKWTQKVFPEFLTEALNMYYELSTYTDQMNKIAGGYLLKKILNDMNTKIDGTLSPKGRKIFLYSGHDFNVANILGALKVFEPHMPPYASYVVMELHKIHGIFGIKILYENYAHIEPPYLAIPSCDIFCPVDRFFALTESVIPSDDDADLCFS